MQLRIALGQFNAVVGDVAGNLQRMKALVDQARDAGVQLVAFPEMSITGYPPEDLLLKSDFLSKAQRASDELVAYSRGLTIVFGGPIVGVDVSNGALVAHDGELAGVYRKQQLPNYGVFDENRYYRPGEDRTVFELGPFRFGVTVCEDIWYPDGPARDQAIDGGARLLLNISASPWHLGKGPQRERMLSTRAFDHNVYVAYCNLVGGQDELMFDGQSVAFAPDGSLIGRAKAFEDDLLIVDLEYEDVLRKRLMDPRMRREPVDAGNPFEVIRMEPVAQSPSQPLERRTEEAPEGPEEVYKALVLGVRDYVLKSGFRKVVIGSSGGVDSALTAVIAVDALGAENVTTVAMPTRYSSSHSLEDAEQLGKNLGCQHMVLPIDDIFASFLTSLDPLFLGKAPDLTEENLQPRIRGTALMALSNKHGWLVLTTGNKSEIAVGYSTLYGDTAGGFAVIKDVPKTLVYDVCRYRNSVAGFDIIPDRILTKAPSAELRPDQKDSDSLPEYEVLDPIMRLYVEQSLSISEIIDRGFDEATVRRVVRMIDRNEYKRRQNPPGLKITARAFGKDWRLPICNGFTNQQG